MQPPATGSEVELAEQQAINVANQLSFGHARVAKESQQPWREFDLLNVAGKPTPGKVWMPQARIVLGYAAGAWVASCLYLTERKAHEQRLELTWRCCPHTLGNWALAQAKVSAFDRGSSNHDKDFKY